jgi:hypothetical protein
VPEQACSRLAASRDGRLLLGSSVNRAAALLTVPLSPDRFAWYVHFQHNSEQKQSPNPVVEGSGLPSSQLSAAEVSSRNTENADSLTAFVGNRCAGNPALLVSSFNYRRLLMPNELQRVLAGFLPAALLFSAALSIRAKMLGSKQQPPPCKLGQRFPGRCCPVGNGQSCRLNMFRSRSGLWRAGELVTARGV